MLRAVSRVLKFLLELAAFAAFAYWGASAGGGVIAVVLATTASALAIVLWTLLAAPRSERRLATPARIPFASSLFGLAVVALFVAGAPTTALVLAVLALASTALLSIIDQREACTERRPSVASSVRAKRTT